MEFWLGVSIVLVLLVALLLMFIKDISKTNCRLELENSGLKKDLDQLKEEAHASYAGGEVYAIR